MLKDAEKSLDIIWKRIEQNDEWSEEHIVNVIPIKLFHGVKPINMKQKRLF